MVYNLSSQLLLMHMIYLQLAPMRKILWSIGLLFIASQSFSQSKAEMVSYTNTMVNNQYATELHYTLDKALSETAINAFQAWKEHASIQSDIEVNNEQLIVRVIGEHNTGMAAAQVLKQLGIERVVVSRNDMTHEINIDEYIEKTSK